MQSPRGGGITLEGEGKISLELEKSKGGVS